MITETVTTVPKLRCGCSSESTEAEHNRYGKHYTHRYGWSPESTELGHNKTRHRMHATYISAGYRIDAFLPGLPAVPRGMYVGSTHTDMVGERSCRGLWCFSSYGSVTNC